MDGSAAEGADVLRRKARRHRVVAEVRVSPEKALRLSLGKAARDELKLALTVDDVDLRLMALAELLDLPPERAFIGMLEGPGEGLGVVMLDARLFCGLIEQLTMKRILPQEPPVRMPTRTDAAMLAGLIDRVLTELETALIAIGGADWALGWRYASFLDDPRPLQLLLDDRAHRVFTVDCDLASGARQGRMILALPVTADETQRRNAPLGPTGTGPRGAAAAAQDWTASLARAVMPAPARLDAVLARLALPISELAALAPGAVIPLPGAGLDNVALASPGRADTPVARGRLGQQKGQRALRLTLPDGG